MADRIVVDTGPIIALARASALDVVARLPIEFVSPIEVREELEEGVRGGHPTIVVDWLRFATLASGPNPLAVAELDRGEAAAIQLALEQRIRLSPSTSGRDEESLSS
jgi:predicted nucleic acid-binding protein